MGTAIHKIDDNDRKALIVIASMLDYVRREVANLDAPQPDLAHSVAIASALAKLSLGDKTASAAPLDLRPFAGGD